MNHWIKVATVLAITPVLAHCKVNNGASAQSAFDPNSSKSMHFSFAKYAMTSSALKAFQPHVSKDQTYVGLGDQTKFQVQTNLTSDIDDDLTKTSSNMEFWLDGYLLNTQIAGTGGHGQALDMLTHTSLKPVSAGASLRFLGKTILKSDFSTAWDKKFTRDLGDASLPYSVPMLGVALNVNIGGEFGIRGDLEKKNANTASLTFVPSVALTGAVAGKAKVLNFASADVTGQAKIIETQLAASTNLGYYPDLKLVTGSIGIDSGAINALDGQVSIGANVNGSLNAVLPAEVDAKLWQPIVDKIPGMDKVQWQWKHVIWDPQPVVVKEVPAFMATGQAFTDTPDSVAECNDRVASFQDTVTELNQNIDTKIARLTADNQTSHRDDVAAQIKSLGTVKADYNKVLADTKASCKKI